MSDFEIAFVIITYGLIMVLLGFKLHKDISKWK